MSTTLSSKQSGLIVAALDDTTLNLSIARANLVLSRDLIRRDTGDTETLDAALGGLRLIQTTVVLEGYRWQGYHDARKRRW